nr:helix-turn-helix transcriptional regulator [Arthrobacter caoxuetaonis]
MRRELTEKGRTQSELSEKLGIHPVTMNLYPKGRRHIPMPTFFLLADELGMTPSDLLGAAESRVAAASPEGRGTV